MENANSKRTLKPSMRVCSASRKSKKGFERSMALLFDLKSRFERRRASASFESVLCTSERNDGLYS